MEGKDVANRKFQRAFYEKIRKQTKNITYADCLLAIEYDCRVIKYIPQELLTEELCLVAINSNPCRQVIAQYIPKELLAQFASSLMNEKNAHISQEAVRENGSSQTTDLAKKTSFLKKSPTKLDKNAFDDMFGENFKGLRHIEKPDVALCEYVIKYHPQAIGQIKNFSHLPSKTLLKAIKSDWKNIKRIPPKMITRKICDSAFDISWRSFKYFPNKLKTLKHCSVVTDMDVTYLQYCPASIVTLEICLKCITKQGILLQYVPEFLINEQICLLAVKQDYTAVNYIPNVFLTQEMYAKCFETNWQSIACFPDEQIKPDVYKAALKQAISSSEFIESKVHDGCFVDVGGDKYYCLKKASRALRDFNLDSETLELERKLFLRITINSEYDAEAKLFRVDEHYYGKPTTTEISRFEDYCYYMNGNFKGADLTEYDFEGFDTKEYDLSEAYLNSALLAYQKQYDDEYYNSVVRNEESTTSFLPLVQNEVVEAAMITHSDVYEEKLNDEDRKIYYITDLHLNHRLIERFPLRATYDEVRLFIKKHVKKIIQSTGNIEDKDYVLVGGDVSSSFQISQIFYKELCKHFNPAQVVVILGNHELWETNCETTETPESIITRYREFFDELGIMFLHNSVLIVKNFTQTILSEKEILSLTTEDLRKISLDSNLMIFGSVGFSAYNPNFNASHGIYKNAITSLEKDLELTKVSESVYEKLCEAYSRSKIIVLSHMPPVDWTKRSLVPGWIYVNGHTHHNHYELVEDTAIYADNQIGYSGKNPILKYFKSSLEYDIFKYYDDGIYHITRDQYIEFNNGCGIYCSFNRDVPELMMLKKEGVYLFLMKNSSNGNLYLLNGGMINKLKNKDTSYYYENMVKHSDFIKKMMKGYNDALKSISRVVKQIGGDGNVHGCIVDIDFFNHIYLNPETGFITAYHSSFFGERTEYPTIEKLLEVRLPHIYEKYCNLLSASGKPVVSRKEDLISNETKNIFDTSQYKPSRLIKRLQYVTENNVIRIWNEDFIKNYEQYLSGNKQLIE